MTGALLALLADTGRLTIPLQAELLTLVGIVLSVTLPFAGYLISLNSRVTSLERDVRTLGRQMTDAATAAAEHGRALARIEVRLTEVAERLASVRERLDRDGIA